MLLIKPTGEQDNCEFVNIPDVGNRINVKKGKGAHELRSIATPPERDASLSQGYSPTPSSVYPIVWLGEERQSGAEFLV